MSADAHPIAAIGDGWDASPAHRMATAAREAMLPRIHRMRLIPLCDGYPTARGGEAYAAREYHPYGLMVWHGYD
ncbi:MAG TPA: hypothetical protein VF092_04470 [Longimicrobium sp.]